MKLISKKFGNYTAEYDCECVETFVFCKNYSASMSQLDDCGTLEDRDGNTHKVPQQIIDAILDWEQSVITANN